VTIRIDWLLTVFPVAERNLTENTQPLASMVVESATRACTLAVRGWLHDQDADGVDIRVLIQAGVGALVVPVERHAVAMAGEGVQAFPGIVAAGVATRHLALGNGAVRIALALVEARRADEAERRAFGQMLGSLAVIGQARPAAWLINPVDALVRHQCARPAFVVL